MINIRDKELQKYIDEKYQIIFKKIKAVYEHIHEEEIKIYKIYPIHIIDDNSPFSIKYNLMPKFSEVLLKFIDKKNMTDAECYKKAGIDRRLFSKIRSDKDYYPSKKTVFSFIIALELDISDAEELMESAGYCISNSYLQDVIITFCIKNKIYNIREINLLLAQYGAKTIN